MSIDTLVDPKATAFERFNNMCKSYSIMIAKLYVNVVGKSTLIRSILRLVTKLEPYVKAEGDEMDGNKRWKYKNYTIRLITEDTGHFLQVYTDADMKTLLFTVANAIIYNKTGKRVYYWWPKDYTYDVEDETKATAFLLCHDAPTIRQLVFDELRAAPRSTLHEHIRKTKYEVTINDTNIVNYKCIPTDFTIRYGADLSKQIHVHKFVIACLSDYFKKLIYGTNEIQGKDSVDLCAFNEKSVEWLARFIYQPKFILTNATTSDWAMLDYIGVDTTNILNKACGDFGLI
ncbi:hypothetical protein D6_00396 [Faustovirus]|nr:hypothetical protein D6_00396 [Faustovirus]